MCGCPGSCFIEHKVAAMESTSAFPESTRAPLKGDVDVFNGVRVQAKLLDVSEQAFGELLQESLSIWTEECRTGVWLMVPNTKARCVSVLGVRSRSSDFVLTHFFPHLLTQ